MSEDTTEFIRKCYVCKMEKHLDEFMKDKDKPKGRGYRCKKCSNEKTKLYKQKRKERQKEDTQGLSYILSQLG